MKYSLGLDIGITSVGWAVLNLDKKRVEALGVRGFNAAEDPKTWASLALPRRLARSARRRLRRRAGRLRRARDLFIKYELIQAQEIKSAFETVLGQPSPWELRAEGLDRLLTGQEFARALFHIIKRRGFKSNRKAAKSSEDGKMIAGIEANRERMREKGFRTAGEMYWSDPFFDLRKRNTTDSYINTVDRGLLEEEIKTLFKRQRELGSVFTKHEFENAILEVFSWQKPYVSGDDIIRMVGTCTFEPNELRAPRYSYHAERFLLLQKINSTTYSTNGDKERFTPEQRKVIEGLAYKNVRVTYAQIRKALDLPEEARFAGLTYLRRPEKKAELVESLECENTVFFELKGYHSIQNACSVDGMWDRVKQNPELMDNLATALTFYKTDEDIEEWLTERGVEKEIINAVSGCEFTKTANLSLVAIKKILPHLEEGLHYSEACAKAGYNHTGLSGEKKKDKLPSIPVDMIRNPVVLRALSQARKVVNAVINRYGSPYAIHIEFARDMGKSADKRKEEERRQRENLKEREELEEQFRETFDGREPNGTDMLKWRLYREQRGCCAYSLQPIDLNRLCEPGYVEVDHILPYSRSFDNSRANKVLVLISENRNKLNRTPYEYFGHNEKRWSEYEGWVRTTIRDPRKRGNLLRESFEERQEVEWKDRNLNDTRYVAREFAGFIRANLLFADPDNKLPLVCINGQVVAQARWLWGLYKDRDENDLHHAQDAAVIAALLPYQIKMITEYSKVVETRRNHIDPETGEIIEWKENERPRLPEPWKGFRKEGVEKLGSILVSRMPQRKVSGAIHADTIRSAKHISTDRVSVVKKPLNSLSENDLKNLFDTEHNKLLYSAIRQRMAEFDNKAQKAFAEPLFKPLRDGSPGPMVRSVKVCQAQYTGVNVRGGIADNGDMVRTDVFRKQNKKGKWEYYLIPVYTVDMISGKLPDKAIAAHKPYNEWPVIDNEYEFLFTLYPYDLIRVETKDGGGLYYYRSSHRANGSLIVCNVNKADTTFGIGSRTAISIEKLEMGVLGDYFPVHKEIRRGLENGSHLEPDKIES